MKVFAVVVVILLVYLAHRVPTAREIGEAVVDAQEDRVRKREMARFEAQRRLDEEDRKAEAAQKKSSAEAARLRELQSAQAEFDALPKWDLLARPINRAPPPGLSPTASIPPPPPTVAPKRTPTPAERAAEVARKFGGQ